MQPLLILPPLLLDSHKTSVRLFSLFLLRSIFFGVTFMEMFYSLLSGLRWLKNPFWKLRRFFRRIRYGIADLLMILGGSVILSAVWYFMFLN